MKKFVLAAALACVAGGACADDAPQSSQPPCSKVEFTGLIAGNPYNFAQLVAAKNKEDMMARNPLQCRKNWIGLFGCVGLSFEEKKPGFVLGWDSEYLLLAAPVELIGGRKDAMIYVRRGDTMCINSTKPSLKMSDNLDSFLNNPTY